MKSTMEGKDAFLSMKSGGKTSLCYHAFPILTSQERRVGAYPQSASSCDFATAGHIKWRSVLQSLGLSATYIGRNTTEVKDIMQGKFQFLFATPEFFGL